MELVAPLTAVPARAHWYENDPRPSSSDRALVTAVRVLSSATVPVIVTAPAVASLTLSTAAVAALVTDSAVPWPSV